MKNRIKEDPIFKAQQSIIGNYLENILPESREAQSKLSEANKLFIAALMKMYPEKDFYSDANFTMRMTYGSELKVLKDSGTAIMGSWENTWIKLIIRISFFIIVTCF